MELIVRTAHGIADVSVDVQDSAVSLGDVIAEVTGQASPAAAAIDDRLVDTRATLAACDVVTGAVVDTAIDTMIDSVPRPDEGAVATLRQLTGLGAGRQVPLSAGRYRVGPGRRQQGAELSRDTIGSPAFELRVRTGGVTVSGPTSGPTAPPPLGSPVRVAGAVVGELGDPIAWSSGPLVVDGKMFQLDDVSPPSPVENGAIGSDGYIVHNRPPGVTARDRTIATAVDDARSRVPRLWHRRSAEGSIRVDIGLIDPDGPAAALQPVSLDLARERVVAVVGGSSDRAAFARALLVDLCTQYGPADVDLVVAATPSELEAWDWAKWLPHLRSDSSVDLLTNGAEMAEFAARALERRTVVVVTAESLWNGAASPMRPVVIDAMANTSVVVLTADARFAPVNTTSLVALDHERPGAATLSRFPGDNDAGPLDLLIPLVDADLATDVARRLAPLLDPDRTGSADAPTALSPREEIVPAATAGARWNTALGSPANPVEMPVGTTANGTVGNRTVGVDLSLDASVAISGSTIDEALDLATTLTLSIASTWSPAEVGLLFVDHRPEDRAEGGATSWQQLPQHIGTFSERDPASIHQLLTRLRADVSGERPSAQRLVIAINGLADTELAAPGLVDELTALAADSVGVHLIISTARPLTELSAAHSALCPIQITVRRSGGTAHATMHDWRLGPPTVFFPAADSGSDTGDTGDANEAAAFTVRPFVFGRAPSSLERRLERRLDRQGQSGSERRRSVVERLAAQLRDLATGQETRRPRPLVRTPLPQRVVASDLWARHSGDGVPLGIVEPTDRTDPAAPTDPVETVDWWLPGLDGSRLFVGSPRSGVREALDALIVGIADRFSTDDVEIVAIDPSRQRRAAIAGVAHVTGTASADEVGAVESLLVDVATTMHERSGTQDFRLLDHPTILVLIRDFEDMSDPAIAAISHLFADGARVGINIVGAAVSPDRISAVATAALTLVVGALSDPDHYAQLGVERSAEVERHAGRAQIIDRSARDADDADDGDGAQKARLVQLVELGAPFEQALRSSVAPIGDDA